MKWEQGRQGTGYEKLCIFSSSILRMDCYLLKYKVGSSIPWHRDPLEVPLEHWRMNIFLKNAKRGGEFKTKHPTQVNWRRLQIFRPDQNLHKVTEVLEGTRYVLSFGLARIGYVVYSD